MSINKQTCNLYRPIHRAGIFALSVTLMAPLSALAQSLPFPDGLYATDPQYCVSDLFALGEEAGIYTRRLEKDKFFWGYESQCKIKTAKQFGDDVLFDLECEAEGEVSERRLHVFSKSQTSFEQEGQTFSLCQTTASEPSSDFDATDIAFIQEALNTLGYNAGIEDGNIGGKTRRAIRLFQQDNALTATGRLDAETTRLIFEAERQAISGNRSDTEFQSPAPEQETVDTASTAVQLETVRSTTQPNDLPEELRFTIPQPVYSPRHFRIAECDGFFGAVTFDLTNQSTGQQASDRGIHDVCVNASRTVLQFVGNLPLEDNSKAQDANLWNYKMPGLGRGNEFSLAMCDLECFDLKKPFDYKGLFSIYGAGNLREQALLNNGEETGFTSKVGSFSGFLVSKNELKTSLADGTYELFGSILPVVDADTSITVGLSGVAMTIEGEMVVKNNIAKIRIFEPQENYQSKASGEININDPSGSFVLASHKNWLVEGYKPETYTYMQADIRHIVPLTDGKSLGVVGLGNLNFVQSNGNVITVSATMNLNASNARLDAVDEFTSPENANAEEFPYPWQLIIPVTTKLYQQRHDQLELCNADRGIAWLKENPQPGHDHGVFTLVDLCLNENSRTFQYIDRVPGLEKTFSFDDGTNLTYSSPDTDGGLRKQRASINVCKLGCENLYYPPFRHRFTVTAVDGSVDNPKVAYLKKYKPVSPQHHRFFGFVRGRLQPNLNELDGKYTVFGYGETLVIQGTMIVQDGVGTIRIYNPDLEDSSLVDLKINFKTIANSHMDSFTRDKQSGSSFDYYRHSFKHMLALHNKNSIGVVGLGNADWVHKDGRIENKIVGFQFSAVKVQ